MRTDLLIVKQIIYITKGNSCTIVMRKFHIYIDFEIQNEHRQPLKNTAQSFSSNFLIALDVPNYFITECFSYDDGK